MSVDGNRYVDINPAPGWTGDITVVMRVTDPGGLSDTDRFVVTVSLTPGWWVYMPLVAGGYAVTPTATPMPAGTQ